MIFLSELWQERFIRLAREISTWSKDVTQIGAVAIDPVTRRVLSVGYNGFPSGIADTEERRLDRNTKYLYTVHGELNCILNAVKNGVSLNGAYLFVWGLPVCSECAKAVIQVGITHVFWSVPNIDEVTDKWIDSMKLSTCMFNETNIKFTYVQLKNEKS
jgi:dCMP deaminase